MEQIETTNTERLLAMILRERHNQKKKSKGLRTSAIHRSPLAKTLTTRQIAQLLRKSGKVTEHLTRNAVGSYITWNLTEEAWEELKDVDYERVLRLGRCGHYKNKEQCNNEAIDSILVVNQDAQRGELCGCAEHLREWDIALSDDVINESETLSITATDVAEALKSLRPDPAIIHGVMSIRNKEFGFSLPYAHEHGMVAADVVFEIKHNIPITQTKFEDAIIEAIAILSRAFALEENDYITISDGDGGLVMQIPARYKAFGAAAGA